jgi:ribosome-binding factor A
MPQKKPTNRMDKVNETLRKEISLIIDQDLKNPNITGIISVTKVKTAVDLSSARVYISLLNCKSKKNTLQGIKKASGYIRSELAKRINLRYTPELIFEIDESMEYGSRIENILKEIMPPKNEE